MIHSTMQDVPLSTNSILERAGKLFPNSEITTCLPNGSVVRHTFAEIYRRSRQLAAALRAAGLKKGERVATLSWNHHAHLECYFGVPAAGGVTHTINPRLTPDDIAWIMNDAADRFLIVDDVLLHVYEQVRASVSLAKVIVVPLSRESVVAPMVDYEDFLREAPGAFDYAEHDENDPVAMCYTSGTTGKPRGVVYSHRSTVLHALVASLPDHWGLTAKDKVLAVTPLFHVNCWGVPFACLMMGIALILPGPRLAPADLLDLMAAEQPTFALGVPTIWFGLIQSLEGHPGRHRLPRGMRTLVGGASVPASLIASFERHGASIVHAWGMTETSPLLCLSYLKPELASLPSSEQDRLKTSVGLPAPLVDLRIVDDGGVVLPWDGQSRGEAQVRGPTIARCYHNRPDDRAAFTEDGWLRTGDIATVDPHGYVRIVDRKKDLIKSGGEWISSVEMENVLLQHSSVSEAAVIAIPDERWGERPLACVVLKANADVTALQLRDHLASVFARWQLPDRIERLASIPKTPSGKVSKTQLRSIYAGPVQGEGSS